MHSSQEVQTAKSRAKSVGWETAICTYDSAEFGNSLNSLDSLLLKDVPIPELLNAPNVRRNGRTEDEIFKNRLYDVNDFPLIINAFEADHTSKIKDAFAIFLYKHVWLEERE